MHVQEEEALLRHGRLVAVQTVDHDRLDASGRDAFAHLGGELARRQLRRVHLLGDEVAALDQGPQIDAHGQGAVEQQSQFLVEGEQGRLFPTGDGRDDEIESHQ